MASGMGMPSIGIYSYELFKFYDVQNIIRIGSAGAYTGDLKLFDVLLAEDAYSESSFARVQCGSTDDVQPASAELNAVIQKAAASLNIPLHTGTIHSSDVFYHESDDYMKAVHDHHALAVEMESFALFSNARVQHKNAACLLTISDSFITHEETTPEQRQTSFTNMMKIALETARLEALRND
jgi:purine-nucleoside phosphorylase